MKKILELTQHELASLYDLLNEKITILRSVDEEEGLEAPEKSELEDYILLRDRIAKKL